jgi:hypothetical protein
MSNYLNKIEFNSNKLNGTMTGGMPINLLLNNESPNDVLMGGKRTSIQSLEDLVVPIGLDLQLKCNNSFEKKRPVDSFTNVISDELFEKMLTKMNTSSEKNANNK